MSRLSSTLSEPLNSSVSNVTTNLSGTVGPSSAPSNPPSPGYYRFPSHHPFDRRNRRRRRRQRTFRSSKTIEYEEDRTIFFHNHPETPLGWTDEFIDNTVRTARYTWYNFIPLFLLQQFRRGANFYFLVICILQIIPSISITNSVPTTAIPLAAVLLFDGIVTAREDYVRYRDDQISNYRFAYISRNRNESFHPVPWKDIKVGDIVRIRRGEEFPADLIFLAASHDDPEQRGFCHVQTAQLDGETNLKLRQSPETIYPNVKNDDDAQNFHGKIVCEAPNEFFGKFTGVYYPYVESSSSNGTPTPIDSQSTLLRGCILRNVDQIYGVVVYTGDETKVRVNQKSILGKKAAIETQINRNILALFLLQCILCVIGAIGFVLWNNDPTNLQMWYLQLTTATFGDAITQGLTFFLYTSNLIPISLYVTMKLVRTAQTFFMNADDDCVYIDEEQFRKSQGLNGKYPLRVRSLDLNDELGQITHFFSDKTGTLTSNYMELRKLSINSIAYGLGSTEIGIARRRRLGIDTTPNREHHEYIRGVPRPTGPDPTEISSPAVSSVPSPKYFPSHSSSPVPMQSLLREIPHVNYLDGSEDPPDHYLRGPCNDINGTGARNAPGHALACHFFFLNLALNHTVVLERIHDTISGKYTGVTQLSASSPDEEAFLLAAEYFGYKFFSRIKDKITLMIYGTEYYYRIVTILPYTQARKMMSILVEDLQYDNTASSSRNGISMGRSRYYLFTKGADSKVLKNLSPRHYASSVDDDKIITTEKQPLNGCTNEPFPGVEGSNGYAQLNHRISSIHETDEINTTDLKDDDDEEEDGDDQSMIIRSSSPSVLLSSSLPTETILPGSISSSQVYKKTKDHTREWAEDGLRTLIFAFKPVADSFVESWVNNFRTAITDLDEKRKQEKNEPNRIDNLQQEMEKNLILQGATANEDKLQDGVPETISMLAEAGVKVAMLTGDRQETAVNIGFATRLLTTEYEQFIMTVDALDHPEDAVALVCKKATSLAPLIFSPPVKPSRLSQWFSRAPERLRKPKHEYIPFVAEPAIPFALIVDELVMDTLLRGHENRRNFLIVFSAARAVICCRCRPDQKRQMVDLVRTGIRDARTLAIGDGANDVDMILTANVGVGISGAEGVQAANASDYAIGRFRFLQKLLFVHGRWNYNRISLVVLYMFWKNVLFAFAQLPFIPTAAWDGQRFFIEIASQTYNLIFTGMPILIAGTLDQDITAKNALRFPYLYSDGIAHRRLDIRRLILTMIDAMVEGLLIYVFCWLSTTETSFQGSVPYIFELGTYVFTAVIIVVSLRLAIMVHRHYWLFMVSLTFCTLLWVGVAWIIDALNADRCQGCMQLIFGNATFWFLMLFIPILVLLPVMLYLIIHRWDFPEYRDLVIEAEAVLPRENEPPTYYQSCLTFFMRRSAQPYRTSAQVVLMNIKKEEKQITESTTVITPVLPPVDIHRSMFRRPSYRWVPFPNVERRTLPLRGDIELALRDWPAQQRLYLSLVRMQNLHYSDSEIMNRWYTLLQQRLLYLMEKEGTLAQVLPYMYSVRRIPPVLEDMIVPLVRLEEIIERPSEILSSPSPAVVPVIPKRKRQRPITIGVPAELFPSTDVAAARMGRITASESRERIPVIIPTPITRPPRTGSDFSVDLTHMNVYSNLLSSMGQRNQNLPVRTERRNNIGSNTETTSAPLPLVMDNEFATVPLVGSNLETVPNIHHQRLATEEKSIQERG